MTTVKKIKGPIVFMVAIPDFRNTESSFYTHDLCLLSTGRVVCTV